MINKSPIQELIPDDLNPQSSQNARPPYLYEALISFMSLFIIMSISIMVYNTDPHMPMLLGVMAAAVVAMRLGHSWEDVLKSMYHGIYQALQAIMILMIIGVLIGVWILSGVVPTMVSYGLDLISPQFFLIATLLICSITSLATGTSWGTMGTMGVALIGIAAGLDIPLPLAAGAIISGAYFGDKMSPLSDTTNLAPVVAGSDLFTHIKFMMPSTVITYLLAIAFFWYQGMGQSAADVDLGKVQALQSTLAQHFAINPLLLLPPLLVIVAIAFKVPAIPGITLGIFSAAILAPIFQEGANLGALLNVGMNGFKIESGLEAIDELLNTGGLMNMMSSVSLTIIAMMYGGIMDRTGQLEVIVSYLLRFLKSPAQLVTGTIFTGYVSNATMPEQYISIVVPGKMYAKAYEQRGLDAKTLSNALESGGTVTSALVPWNTCGIFIFSVLGVSTYEYFAYAFFNYAMPLVVIAMAYVGGITIAYKKAG